MDLRGHLHQSISVVQARRLTALRCCLLLPGSAKWRPYQTTSFSNLFMAGDWVKGLDHGANGLSQERAWITGLTAANLVIKKLGRGQPAEILPGARVWDWIGQPMQCMGGGWGMTFAA